MWQLLLPGGRVLHSRAAAIESSSWSSIHSDSQHSCVAESDNLSAGKQLCTRITLSCQVVSCILQEAVF
jgi:hypothetical protein